MKKIIIGIFVLCTLLCVNVFAIDDYMIVNMSEFEEVDNFSEGICAVQDKTTKRWGFVDVNKNWIISPQFKSASYFKNGYCAVSTVDGDSALIDHNGKIIYKSASSFITADSENLFLLNHGEYKVVFDQRSCVLLDKNNNSILNDVNLEQMDKSTVFFSCWKKEEKELFAHKEIYNYKGQKVADEEANIIRANNKYMIGIRNNEIIVYNIDGKAIVHFDTPTGDYREISLEDDLIILQGNYIPTIVYNIPMNKKLFDSNENSDVWVSTYYNKYFTVKKGNGTSALYSKSGDVIVDFGKWDNIIPASIVNRMIVEVSQKYGIADFDGNIEVPIDFNEGVMKNNGKTAVLVYANYVLFDMKTLQTKYSENMPQFGGGRIVRHSSLGEEYDFLDEQMNFIYTETPNLFMNYNNEEQTNQGVYEMRTRDNTSKRFLIFNDMGGVKVELDNSKLEFDVSPVIINGRTLVPMRAIFEALGADVEWDGETQTIVATNKDTTIKMQIGNNVLTKNGQNLQIDVSPQLIDGRTMVPVRAISDSFNVLVDWNGYTQTVSLFTN